VTTNRSSGGPLTVTVDPAAAFVVGEPAATLVDGGLGALVPVGAIDPTTGAIGDLTLHVSDGAGGTADTTVHVAIAPVSLAPDTLYAIPLQHTVHIGEPVTVLVATGPTAHPFHYMNSVGLTMPSDGTELWQSFDVGAVGRSGDTEDGIWAAIDVPPGAFLFPDDFPVSADIGQGLERWDFSLDPAGGHEVAGASGVLFNVQFTFSAPGTKHFGFQQFDLVKRTYYSDDATEYFWGNIANDGSGGIPNSVTVTD
jgi:hypothetical protein